MSKIYDFTAQSLAGDEVSLKRFEGQVLLIVNTASACGFTPQYKGMEALHRELSPRGFAVLGFPCNQFGAQEPGDAKAIETFCETKYHVTFPMFAKIDVNGSKAHPLYNYLTREKYAVLLMPVSGELPFPDQLDRKDDASFARVWHAQLPQIAIPFMGLPGLTVSTGLVGRIPVGVQLVSGRYREDLCLAAGEAIEAGGTPSAVIDPAN